MTAYLRWSVRQFYYLLFQPTAFERENHTLEQGFLAKPLARSVYLAKLVPGTLILSSLVLLTVGWRWEESHGHFSWTLASVGILVGIASGIAFGALFGVGFGITTSLGSSIACSLNIGFTGGMPGAMIMGLGLGSAVGLTTRFHPGLVIGGIIGLIGTTDHSLNHGVAAGARSSVFYFATFGVSFFLVRYRLLDFPLHAFLDWLGCRGLRNDLSQAPRRWARHPLAWNETIHLPLPCAREFLSLLVQYDRDFGFQKIAFVAAERPRQRRAAGAALEEIALNDLAVQSAGDFTRTGRALAWLTQPPAALPELLTELIPHFVRAAQFMAQGQALSGRFRQLEAVENAQSELAGIRTHLIGRPGELGPRLLRRANDWTTLIEAEHRRLKSLAVVEPEIPQVFRFGNPVREDESYVFAGRGKLVHELEAVLLGDARPPAILIHGARRMGKSSILCQLPRLLGPGFAPGTVDCQNPAVSGGAPALFAALSRTLAECLARRGVSVEPLTRAALTPDPFSLFDDWLRGVERAMPDPLRALLCFDEYEALHPGVTDGWGSALLDYLRHLQQHRSKFVLVFAGVRPFHALGREWTSRFVSTRATRVSFLSPEELRPLLERPVPRFNLRYQGESLDLLLRLTGGQPLLTQVVAFELVSQLNLERRHDASPADVLAAASNALQSAEGYFANVWDDAEPDGRARLWEAVQGRPVPAGPTRTRLREMDVVNDQGNIAVPLLAQWVSQLGNSIAWEREPGAGSVSEFLPA